MTIERYSEDISIDGVEDIDPDNDELWDRLSEAYTNERDRCEEEVRLGLTLALS